MVRTISQEIFNETVIENCELLDLSEEDAIEETVIQFKAQGVDLTHVVKDVFFLSKENPVSLIVVKINNTTDEDEIFLCVNKLKDICARGIEYKIFCGKEQVYDVLIEKLNSTISLKLKMNILEFFTILFDGYPDILNLNGCVMFLSMLELSSEIQKITFNLIDIACLKHEKNRQMFVENGIISHITRILDSKPTNDILCCIFNIIAALTRDDDIRTDTSKRYIHACSLSNELLKPFCRLLKDKRIVMEPSSVECLFNALSSIVVNNDHCVIVDSEECLRVVIDLLKKYRQHEKVLVACFTFLFNLAGNDDVNVKIVKCDIALELASAMNNYINNKQIVLSSLKLTSRLCLRKPCHGQIFFKIDFPALVIQALKVHKRNGSIQVAGCWCIRNMVSRNHEFSANYLVLGAEEILNEIIKNFKEYAQDAKFSLIELGCNVKLDELWIGKEGDKLKHT